MLGPILVVALLVRAALGHGREIPCEPNTCPVISRPVTVDMGPHYDKRTRVEVVQPDGRAERAGPERKAGGSARRVAS